MQFLDSANLLPTIESAVLKNMPVLLIGETGTGKTTLVRELAKKHGRILVRVSLNGATGVEEIIGKWTLYKKNTVWLDGLLVKAMKQGHWIVFDEINACLPEILFTCHSLLDDDRKVILAEKDGEVVIPHPDFRFFATMNPCANYAGTKDLNTALLSRFSAVLHVPHLTEQEEVKILIAKTGINEIDAGRFVRLAQDLREQWRGEKIQFYCSTRDIIAAGLFRAAGLSNGKAVEAAVLGKSVSPEDMQIVKATIERYMTLEDGACLIKQLDPKRFCKLVADLYRLQAAVNYYKIVTNGLSQLSTEVLEAYKLLRDAYEMLLALVMEAMKQAGAHADELEKLAKKSKDAGTAKALQEKAASLREAIAKAAQVVDSAEILSKKADKKLCDAQKERGDTIAKEQEAGNHAKALNDAPDAAVNNNYGVGECDTNEKMEQIAEKLNSTFDITVK